MAVFGEFWDWITKPFSLPAPPNPNFFPRLNGLPIPISVLTDSYKVSHPFQYPDAQKMVAYGEFRNAFEKDKEDERMVFFGIRYIIENYVSRQWTMWDVEIAEKFFQNHNAGFTPFPFPKDIFVKFIRENNGFFPVKIEALPEGSVIYPHVPVYQITATGEYSRLVTFLETILTMVWYPSTVATLSRKARQAIQDSFDKTVDQKDHFWVETKLQDFGFRGCTSVEQSVIGGTAHLLNFSGTDTMSAAFYAQYILNNGKPVGNSIPATEHSVMTSFKTEKAAIENMINRFGSGVFAVVMDTYDFTIALEKVLPAVYQKKLDKGGFMVLRPDSGEPVDVVLEALRNAEKVAGFDLNEKGFKVLRGISVIQGDGVGLEKIKEILEKVEAAGFSAQNCTFGMGAGLLQKVNRDTMSFATKLNFIIYADGTKRNVMKYPKTDKGKISLPGALEVRLNENKLPVVYPKSDSTPAPQNLLRVVYDKGPVNGVWEDFETLKTRVNEQWSRSPRKFNPISEELTKKIEITVEEQRAKNAEANKELGA